MIPGIAAGQMRNQRPPILVGTTSTSESATGPAFTLSVPAGVAAGDVLVAILRCRYDRAFSVPAGWTLLESIQIGTDPDATKNTRLYLMSKLYSGEATVTFTQNVVGAAVANLMAVRGVLGGRVVVSGSTNSMAPSNPISMLIAVGTTSGGDNSAAVWTPPFVHRVSAKWSASSPFFYGSTIATHTPGSVAPQTAAYTWAFGNIGANHSLLVEVLPFT